MDLDGKLILGKDSDDEDNGAMDVDQPGRGGEDSGVGAYVAAIKGRDAGKRGRGGKLKFSNRRSKDGDDGDEEKEEEKTIIGLICESKDLYQKWDKQYVTDEPLSLGFPDPNSQLSTRSCLRQD